MMSAENLAAIVVGAVGAAALTVVGVAGIVRRRRALSAVATGDADGLPRAASPSVLYHLGIWLVVVALGLRAGPLGALVLGAAGLYVVAVSWQRSGIRLDGDDLVLGNHAARSGIPVERIGAVVAAPRGSFYKSLGAFGIADDDGRWLAVVRYHSGRDAAGVVGAVVLRCGLVADPAGGAWRRPGARLPGRAVPFSGFRP